VNNKNSYEIVIPLEINDNLTDKQKLEIASALDLPEDTQPDLLYFQGILVSSGENLNSAFFLPSELVKAEATIVNKPIDIEHNEDDIIGHIYDRVYLSKDGGDLLDLEELRSRSDLDSSMSMDIAIAGVIYKDRFPKISKEIKKGEWALSMETYYSDFEIRIGDLVFSRQEAEVLGLTDVVGSEVAFVKDGEELVKGKVVRVLRDLTFCGCGIVKNPANPDSVFLDVANKKDKDNNSLIVDVTKLFESANKKDNGSDNNRDDNDNTNVDNSNNDKVDDKDKAQITYPDTPDSGEGGKDPTTVGQCVHYQRFDKNNKEINWCKLYDTKCTSKLRQITDKDCLYYKDYYSTVSEFVEKTVADLLEENSWDDLINKLVESLELARKYKIGG